MHYLQYPTSFTCRYVVENNLLYVEVIDKKVDLVDCGLNNVPHGDWFCYKYCKC